MSDDGQATDDTYDDPAQAREDIASYRTRAGLLLAAALFALPMMALAAGGLAVLARPVPVVAGMVTAAGVDAVTAILCVLVLLPRERGTRRPVDPYRVVGLTARALTAAYWAMIVTAALVVVAAIGAVT